MITLFHDTLSVPARTARLVCDEYGVQYDPVIEQLWRRRDEFAMVNPAMSLPVLVDGGTTVCGLHPVIEYLDETVGTMRREGRLHPDSAPARAEVRRLVDWFATKMNDEVTRHIVRERIEKPVMPAELGGGSPNSQSLRVARSNVKHHLRYLEWLAGSRAWLAGDGISYADMAGAAAVSVLDYMGEIDWAEVPYTKDWYGRMKSRPAFRAVLADRVKGHAPAKHYADLDF